MTLGFEVTLIAAVRLVIEAAVVAENETLFQPATSVSRLPVFVLFRVPPMYSPQLG